MTIRDEQGNAVQGRPGSISRKAFLSITGMSAAAVMLGGGPLQSLGARAALGQEMPTVTGYGPLVPKGDLRLPAAFNYQIISTQGQPQRSNGAPGSEVTPGIFDAMGAYSDTGGGVNPPGDTTILIRNHENRRRAGEIPVRVPEAFRYDEDPSYNGGCTKLVVRQTRSRDNRGQEVREYEVVDSFNILGGTDTNCAGGEMPFKKWITCEEVVNRSPITGKKHGYNFEVDAMSDGPVKAVPILAAGRFVHEATAWRAGILYQTEDRRIQPDPVLGEIGSSLYRYIPDQRVGQSDNLAETTGPLEALAVKGHPTSTPTPSPPSESRSRSSGSRSPMPTTTTTPTTAATACRASRRRASRPRTMVLPTSTARRASGFWGSARARRSTSTARRAAPRTSARSGSTIPAARR